MLLNHVKITVKYIHFRAYLRSHWCRFEFTQAYNMVLQDGRTDYIVVVLLGDVPQTALTDDLKVYLRTFTYIDAKEYRNDIEMIRKKIRFALPKIPLKQNQV